MQEKYFFDILHIHIYIVSMRHETGAVPKSWPLVDPGPTPVTQRLLMLKDEACFSILSYCKHRARICFFRCWLSCCHRKLLVLGCFHVVYLWAMRCSSVILEYVLDASWICPARLLDLYGSSHVVCYRLLPFATSLACFSRLALATKSAGKDRCTGWNDCCVSRETFVEETTTVHVCAQLQRLCFLK